MYEKVSQLQDYELLAARAYGSDSRLHHALAQRIRAADHDPGYLEFAANSKHVIPAISQAIAKFRLTAPLTVYSGIGWGLAAVGALYAEPPAMLVGLVYRYSGFISTSLHRQKAEGFIRSGFMSAGDRPLLLEFNLPAGFAHFRCANWGRTVRTKQSFCSIETSRFA